MLHLGHFLLQVVYEADIFEQRPIPYYTPWGFIPLRYQYFLSSIVDNTVYIALRTGVTGPRAGAFDLVSLASLAAMLGQHSYAIDDDDREAYALEDRFLTRDSILLPVLFMLSCSSCSERNGQNSTRVVSSQCSNDGKYGDSPSRIGH